MNQMREQGPWVVRQDAEDVWIGSEDFTHDVTLIVRGDFASTADKFTYARKLAEALNSAMPLKF